MSEGPQGVEGKQGIQGTQGAQGIQGRAGGPQGEQGIQGLPGARGPAARRVTWRDAWLVLVTGIVLFALAAQNDQNTRLSAQAKAVAASRLFLVQSCERLNILRIEGNISRYADFRSFKADLALYSIVRLVNRSPTVPPQRAFLHGLSVSIAVKKQAIAQKSWVPRTDCSKAVNVDGVRFRPPAPIPFAKRLPTPDALHLEPSDFQ